MSVIVRQIESNEENKAENIGLLKRRFERIFVWIGQRKFTQEINNFSYLLSGSSIESFVF